MQQVAFLTGLDTIAEHLSVRGVPAERGVSRLRISAIGQHGFDVAVAGAAPGFVIRMDRLELVVASASDAIRLVDAAVDGSLRVALDQVDGRPVRWTLEQECGDGRWRALLAEGELSWNFWMRPTRSHLRNNPARTSGAMASNDDALRASPSGIEPCPLAHLPLAAYTAPSGSKPDAHHLSS